MNRFKFPRIAHLPWSLGRGEDDLGLEDLKMLSGHQVVVTEKMDGENTSIYSDGGVHSRSLSSRDHPSRHWVKNLASRVCHKIDKDVHLNVENLFATHSIEYSALPSYAMLFGGWRDSRVYLSWGELTRISEKTGIPLVPVLYRGEWSEEAVRACFTGISKCGGVQEGYVVRSEDEIADEFFTQLVAKFVRPNHVQTDEHWMSGPMRKNGVMRCSKPTSNAVTVEELL